MRILIIAATEDEIQPFLNSDIQKSNPIDILITGVGMVATAYSLTKKLRETSYDILLNVGIAGSFSKDIPLGYIVRVKEDSFSELGAEDDDQFLTLKDLNLGEFQYLENIETPLANNILIKTLAIANGITVNKVHGKDSSIENVIQQFSPDIESMEGAAVFYVAQQENIQTLQIRAISNLVEKRNKDNWNIPIAIKNLNDWLILFISSLR